MVYVWEFEFFDSDGVVDAVPCGSLCHVARWAEVERSDPT